MPRNQVAILLHGVGRGLVARGRIGKRSTPVDPCYLKTLAGFRTKPDRREIKKSCLWFTLLAFGVSGLASGCNDTVRSAASNLPAGSDSRSRQPGTSSAWSAPAPEAPSEAASLARADDSARGRLHPGGELGRKPTEPHPGRRPGGKALSSAGAPTSFDPYGGAASIGCAAATGWFHMEKVGSHWWLCTPQGHGFFSQGVQLVSPDNSSDYFGRNNYSIVMSKYGGWIGWATSTAQRLKSWGFNTVDVGSTVYMMPWLTDGDWPLDDHKLHTLPTKMPFIAEINPGRDSVRNVSVESDNWTGQKVLLTEAVKNLVSGWSALYTGWRYSIIPDYYDPRVYAFLDAELDPKTHISQLSQMWTSPYLNYMMGLSIEDSDQMAGFTTDPAFKKDPSPEWGWTLSTMAPVLTSSYGGAWNYHVDATVYGKRALRDWLSAKYTSVSNLNKAWGSNYTTFDSTGTPIAGEPVGQGDGKTASFKSTAAHLAPSRFSMQVLVNATVIAGEHNNGLNYWDNVGDVGAGMLSGPQVSGSVAFGSGAVTLAFVPSPIAVNSCRTDGRTVSIETHNQHGFWTGANITLTGTKNCEVRNQKIIALDAWHFSFEKTGKFAAEYPANGTATAAIPQSGDSITINYVQNGYRKGTGFMDEDGRHSWIGKDFAHLTDVAPNVAADFHAFLVAMASFYFGTTSKTLHARYPHLLYFDQVGGYSIPARAGTLQGSAPYVDAIMSGDQTVFSPGMLDFQYRNWGDKPLLEGIYLTANPDSDMFPYEASSTLSTQEAKGQQYYNIATEIRNLAYPNGSHPYVGFGVWGYRDMMNERLNWGMVSYGDNAYDGHEDVTAKIACSPPLQTYTCGGEPPYRVWKAGERVAVPSNDPGNRIQVNLDGTYYIFEVTHPGTTGAAQPSWPKKVGSTVTDGNVAWKNVGAKSNPNGFGDMLTKVKQANALWYADTP